MSELSIIVAMSENRVIGRDNALPWHLPDDLKHFKELTVGHAVIMGRKTYDSILKRLKKPLPERMNIVLSRDPQFVAPECHVARGLWHALRLAHAREKTFVIGGRSVYEVALLVATSLYLTLVHGPFKGDVWFPELNLNEWRIESQEQHLPDDRHRWPFTFFHFVRSEHGKTQGS